MAVERLCRLFATSRCLPHLDARLLSNRHAVFTRLPFSGVDKTPPPHPCWTMGVQTFLGKWPRTLVWAGLGAESGKITASGIPKSLNYCVKIDSIYTIYKCGCGSRLGETRDVEDHFTFLRLV